MQAGVYSGLTGCVAYSGLTGGYPRLGVAYTLKHLPAKDILKEDDLPEDGTTLDDVQLENELKIVLKGFADGVRLLKYSRQRNSARTRRNFQRGFGPVSPINPPSCWLGRRPR